MHFISNLKFQVHLIVLDLIDVSKRSSYSMMRVQIWIRKSCTKIILAAFAFTSLFILFDERNKIPVNIGFLRFTTTPRLERKSNLSRSISLISSLEEIRDSLDIVSDDNPQFINYIQKKLVPPSPSTSSLNLHKSIHTGQIGQAEEVIQYFKMKKNGVFVEAGAWDGEYLSNTLYLEAKYNWTGLLVEPNSGAFNKLVTRNRKAHSVHSCLSVTAHPDIVEFDSADVFGGIDTELDNVDNRNLARMRDSIPEAMRTKETVECYPLYSLLLAIGSTDKVDLLSLDIEGAELAVLRAIPWDKVNIELVMIEVNHSDKREIDNVMTSAGFGVYKKLKEQDIIYRKLN